MSGTPQPAASRRARISGTAAAASGRFTVTRTSSEPATASSSACSVVAATSAVSVEVIDCTTTGAPPPIRTVPTCTAWVRRRVVWSIRSAASRYTQRYRPAKESVNTPPRPPLRPDTGRARAPGPRECRCGARQAAWGPRDACTTATPERKSRSGRGGLLLLGRLGVHGGHVERLDLADQFGERVGGEHAGLGEEQHLLAEDRQRRDRADPERGGQLLLRLGVARRERDLRVGLGRRVEDRLERAARAAPLRPEVDQDDVVARDRLVEVA